MSEIKRSMILVYLHNFVLIFKSLLWKTRPPSTKNSCYLQVMFILTQDNICYCTHPFRGLLFGSLKVDPS